MESPLKPRSGCIATLRTGDMHMVSFPMIDGGFLPRGGAEDL